MHADAEGGTAAHSLYKGSLENPAEASLFRSKMTLNTSKPVQHQLPSRSGRVANHGTETAASAGSTEASDVATLDAKIREDGGLGDGGQGAASEDESDRNPQP